jgi:hypothetical protein
VKNAGAARVWIHSQEVEDAAEKRQRDTYLQPLQNKVRRLSAHVKRNEPHAEIAFERQLLELTPDEIKTLARVLRKELLSVIQAVEEAK